MIESVRIQSERIWSIFYKMKSGGANDKVYTCFLLPVQSQSVLLLPGSQAILPFLPLSPPPCLSDYVSILITPRTCLVQVTSNFHDPKFDGHLPSQQRLLWLTSLSFLKHLSWPSGCYALFLPIFKSLSSISFADSSFSSRLLSQTLFSILCVTQVRAHLACDCPYSPVAPSSPWNSDPDLPYSFLVPLCGRLMDIL